MVQKCNFLTFLKHGGDTQFILGAKLITKLGYYQIIFLLKNKNILIN